MKQLGTLSGVERMIQQQIIDRGIRDPRIIDALRAIPRDYFLPTEAREQAHADRATPIGHGQTISQPFMVALMTYHLGLRPEHRVLEIGTGSGYHTAILAHLAGEVYTIERVKPLLDDAFERLMSLNVRNIHLRWGDGTLGWPQAGPFDRIVIAAGAPDVPRELLLSQLKEDGIAVLPVGPQDRQILVEVHRQGDELDQVEICACRFVKLIGKAGWKE